VFRCDRWSEERAIATQRLQFENFPAVADLVDCMLGGKTQWCEIAEFIGVMRQKEMDEMTLKG
jgi:hypothetical protein